VTSGGKADGRTVCALDGGAVRGWVWRWDRSVGELDQHGSTAARAELDFVELRVEPALAAGAAHFVDDTDLSVHDVALADFDAFRTLLERQRESRAVRRLGFVREVASVDVHGGLQSIEQSVEPPTDIDALDIDAEPQRPIGRRAVLASCVAIHTLACEYGARGGTSLSCLLFSSSLHVATGDGV